MHPSKVSETEKSQLVNETRWQYYGTTDARGNLSMTWNATALSTRSVSIELWGYEETGEALCRAWSFQELGLAEMDYRWGESHGGGIPGRDWGEESADKEGELELARLGGGMKGGGEGGVNGSWNPGCKAGPGNRTSLLHPSSLSLWMAGMTLGLASSKGNDCGQG